MAAFVVTKQETTHKSAIDARNNTKTAVSLALSVGDQVFKYSSFESTFLKKIKERIIVAFKRPSSYTTRLSVMVSASDFVSMYTEGKFSYPLDSIVPRSNISLIWDII